MWVTSGPMSSSVSIRSSWLVDGDDNDDGGDGDGHFADDNDDDNDDDDDDELSPLPA